MILTNFATFIVVVHPTCVPFIRQTEETLFQAQTALKISRNELTKLERRRPIMQMLSQEGAISRNHWQQFQLKIQTLKSEITDTETLATTAKAQITTLQAMPQCNPA